MKCIYIANDTCTNTPPHQQHGLTGHLGQHLPIKPQLGALCWAWLKNKEKSKRFCFQILPETNFCYLISKSFQELEIYPTLAKRKIKMSLKCQHLRLEQCPSCKPQHRVCRRCWSEQPGPAGRVLLSAEGLEQMTLGVPSNTNHSIII